MNGEKCKNFVFYNAAISPPYIVVIVIIIVQYFAFMISIVYLVDGVVGEDDAGNDSYLFVCLDRMYA